MPPTWSGDLAAFKAIRASGAPSRYASAWVGPWTNVVNGQAPSLAAHLAQCKAEGAIPFIHFFSAGDQITEAFFDGTVTTSRGMNLGRWWELVKAVGATLAANGNPPCVVSLELEWAKGGTGLQDGAPKFDAAWANAAHTIRGLASNTKIANCPGIWFPASKVKAFYPLMVGATDIWAGQQLESLPRSGVANYQGGPEALRKHLLDYTETFPGKPLIVSDVAFSSYGGSFQPAHPFFGGTMGGADALQKAAFDKLLQFCQSGFPAALTDILIRGLKDVDMDNLNNYHGMAEDAWGHVRMDGTQKPAYASMLAAARLALPAPPPPPPQTFTAAEMAAVVAARDVALADTARLRGDVTRLLVELQGVTDTLNRAKGAYRTLDGLLRQV